MDNLEIYRRYVNEIKKYATENGISAAETNKIFEQCFRTLDRKFVKKVTTLKKTLRFILRALSFVFGVFACTIVLYNHRATHKFVLKNLQNFIYPGLKVFRKIAVPVIEKYPSLTEWYDEWCIVENPYFRVTEMDCWPCSTVKSIPDLTGFDMSGSLNIGMPYTKMDRSKNAAKSTINDLLVIYEKNANIFDNDASRVSSSNSSYRTMRDVFLKRPDENPTLELDFHVTWRITRMKPGRLIRKLFPRTAVLPSTWSQSTEKFVFIDEPNSHVYSLPNPECSNVMLSCTSGSRLINMIPSPECLQSCKSFTILLSAQQSLWYNWWYWRPLSIPAVNSTDISISYLISFC